MSSTATVQSSFTTSDLRADQLDHPEWSRTSPVLINRYWSGAQAPVNRHAEARILWSKHSLCVRFNCQQDEPLVVGGTPRTETKTLGLWDRDVCEIYLAPDPAQPQRYFEFEAAPTGEWIDLAINWKRAGRETNWEFESGMTVAGNIGKEQVTIAMRIPWSDSIVKPQLGDKWRANLFRCVGSGPERGYLAWQPTHSEEPNFHVPESFGWLVFGD